MAENDVENELLDYEEDEQETAAETGGEAGVKKEVKGTYVSIHSSGFRDFLLKPELLRAIVDCGFEHPSEGRSYSMAAINKRIVNLDGFSFQTLDNCCCRAFSCEVNIHAKNYQK